MLKLILHLIKVYKCHIFEAQKWLKDITKKRDTEILTEVIIAEESVVFRNN